jgi:hypothetical protein
MRRIKHQQIQLPMRAAEQPRRSAEQIVEGENFRGGLQRLKRSGIAGHQGADRNPFRAQRRRQRAGDVGEPAGFHDRINFRRDRENAHGAHVKSLMY